MKESGHRNSPPQALADSPTLFLDLDGPILNTTERYFHVYRTVAAELGLKTHLTPESFWSSKRRAESSAQIFGREAPHAEIETFRRRWDQEIESPRWLRLDTLQPSALATLRAFYTCFTVVLVTLRQERAALEAQLTALGLREFFHEVRSASPLGADGVQVKRRLLAASGPAAGVIIGDTEVDIRSGKQCGLGTVAVTCGIRDEALLRRVQPGLLVPSLADVSIAQIKSMSRYPNRRRVDSK